MDSHTRYSLEPQSRSTLTMTRRFVATFSNKRWIGPLLLTILITVFHFSVDPQYMVWHDLLRRAYYIPVIWMVYISGFRGGAISSLLVGAIFTVHLITGWGYHLGSQMDQIYDIIGYLAVGLGVGYIVDRARQGAIAAAQREWDISLRGVISAAIHELKKPKSDIRAIADSLAEHSHQGMWEYALGVRLTRTSDQIDALRRDLAGIAKILSSSSIVTKPFDWALTFAKNQHLHGKSGLIVARTDNDNPPPAIWPVSAQILNEVTRCLLEDLDSEGKIVGIVDLVVRSKDNHLQIECSSRANVLSRAEADGHHLESHSRGWVRMKLLELTWSRYNGIVQRFSARDRQGFRLTLAKPKISLTAQTTPYKKYKPARRIQESNRAYIRMAHDHRQYAAHAEEERQADGGIHK